jgi:hypothetical protein
MARGYQIYGGVMVEVFGARALIDPDGKRRKKQLGLTVEGVTWRPRFRHQEIYCDDFGDEVPAELMAKMADVSIDMTLVHYDPEILDACFANSMGSETAGAFDFGGGQLMGGVGGVSTGFGFMNEQPSSGDFDSSSFYISLNLISDQNALGLGGVDPYRFPYCVLSEQPEEIPLSTEKSMVRLRWRAIPFKRPQFPDDAAQGEVSSRGAVIWDRERDEDDE